MNGKIVAAMALVFTGVVTVHAAAPAEWWLETAGAKKTGPYNMKLFGGTRVRSGGGAYQAYPGVEASRTLTEWLTAGCGCRVVWPAGDGATEYRWSGEGTLRHTFPGKVRADMRCRFEYRQFDEGDDGWRVRTRLRVRGPRMRMSGSPQASAEFFSVADDAVERVRICIGTALPVVKSVALQLNYVNETKPAVGIAEGVHALGTTVSCAFR